MSTKEMKEGDYKVKIVRAELGESYSGKERIELTFEAPDGSQAVRHLYLSPRARAYTFETLEGLGINCEDENYIDKIDTLVGRGCKIRLLVPTGPGKNKTPDVVSVWPLDEDRKKPSQEELKARIRRKHSEEAASTDEPALDTGFSEVEKLVRTPPRPVTPPPVPKPPLRDDPVIDGLMKDLEAS